MQWLNTFMDKFYAFKERVRPGLRKVGNFFRAVGKVFYKIGLYMYRLRSIILAAPVAAVAAILAMNNMERLPEKIEITKIAIDAKADDALLGLFTMSTQLITREIAVFGPVIITAVCLVMMMCSKRTLYPFLISLFTLCLPIVLYYFSIYPM